MNLPNKLTVSRLFLTGAFVAALSIDLPYGKTAALFFFSIAAITDFLDGYLARKHNLITDFGKLMDPLADKVLMASGFVMLCSEESTRALFPAWVVIAILAREFMVTGLRLVAAAEGKVLAAEKLGKHKTIWQIITVIYFLRIENFRPGNHRQSTDRSHPYPHRLVRSRLPVEKQEPVAGYVKSLETCFPVRIIGIQQ